MLTILGRKEKFCDGVSRRSFLKIGAFAFGATQLSLVDVMRAEAAQQTSSHKAVINVFLGGGPPHQDMFDLKMEAPAEIRGEFKPIQTNVNGIQIGECFPQIAKMMDKFAIIRSIVGAKGGHDAFQCTSGWSSDNMNTMGGRPSLGPVIAKVQGFVDSSVPPFVGLAEKTQHGPWSDAGRPGYIGSQYAAFKPSGPDLANMVLQGANKDQFGDRKALLKSFDGLRREVEASPAMQTTDALTERALNVLMSSRLLEAMDLSKEDPKVRARYGDGKPYQFQYDGAPTVNDQLLMARRLVEAGVRCVSLSYGRWDSHGKNFDLVRDHGTKLDQGITALVQDLEDRGMLNDVSVVVWGEFGRTPRINKDAGRDHWPQVSCALLAGGGMRTGQVIGSTNRLGEYAVDRPTTFAEVIATLYHTIGINPMTTTIMDPTSRPQYLVDGDPMRELV